MGRIGSPNNCLPKLSAWRGGRVEAYPLPPPPPSLWRHPPSTMATCQPPPPPNGDDFAQHCPTHISSSGPCSCKRYNSLGTCPEQLTRTYGCSFVAHNNYPSGDCRCVCALSCLPVSLLLRMARKPHGTRSCRDVTGWVVTSLPWAGWHGTKKTRGTPTAPRATTEHPRSQVLYRWTASCCLVCGALNDHSGWVQALAHLCRRGALCVIIQALFAEREPARSPCPGAIQEMPPGSNCAYSVRRRHGGWAPFSGVSCTGPVAWNVPPPPPPPVRPTVGGAYEGRVSGPQWHRSARAPLFGFSACALCMCSSLHQTTNRV